MSLSVTKRLKYWIHTDIWRRYRIWRHFWQFNLRRQYTLREWSCHDPPRKHSQVAREAGKTSVQDTRHFQKGCKHWRWTSLVAATISLNWTRREWTKMYSRHLARISKVLWLAHKKHWAECIRGEARLSVTKRVLHVCVHSRLRQASQSLDGSVERERVTGATLRDHASKAAGAL